MTQQNPTVAFVLILGALSAFGPMSIDMYLPAFPALADSLHTTPGHVAYTLSAFFIGLSAGQLVYGPLADRFGRKPPLIAGLVLYALASVGCALAPTIEILIAMRALQAFGACAGMVMSRAMVRDLFEPSAAARVFSLLILVMGLAPILAPFLGGLVLEFGDWRGIFWSLVAFGVACLAAVARRLPESLPDTERVKLGLGEIASVYGQLLTDRVFMGHSLSGALAQAGMFAYIAGSPFVFITLNGVPENRYGLLFGLNALGFVAVSQINAALVKRLAPTTLLQRGLAFATAMAILLAVNVTTGLGGFVGLLVALFGFVASLGFIGPNAMASAMASRRTHHGQASAMLGTVQFGMATLAGLAVGAMQDGTARPMGLTIAVCGLLALVASQLTARAHRALSAEAA
jgi:DHA1 family bicyclomycin/chloramphenicol resistance-like MFS transporter